MQISTPAKRYANALFQAAEEARATAAILPQIQAMRAALQDDAAAQLLAAPLGRTRRLKLADELTKGLKPHALVANTLGLLAHNNRLALLPQILAAYLARANQAAGIVVADVQSAAALTAAQQTELKATLKAATKASDVALTTTVRPGLLGGFRAFYQGQVWDASVSGQLESLKQRLREKLSSHQKPSF